MGISRNICLRLSSFHVLRISSLSVVFLVTARPRRPSLWMTFSGGETRKARGRPRHCSAMSARYVE
jgi:hypothetical protein